jgi:hypothetical protein
MRSTPRPIKLRYRTNKPESLRYAATSLRRCLTKSWTRTARFPQASKCRTSRKSFAWHISTPSLVTILQNPCPLKTKPPRPSVWISWPQLAQTSFLNSTPWSWGGIHTTGEERIPGKTGGPHAAGRRASRAQDPGVFLHLCRLDVVHVFPECSVYQQWHVMAA